MEKHQPLITYLLSFIAFAILLNLFGIIDFANSEILGYALLFYGISSVYISFEEELKIFLFTGSTAFLTGVLLIIINYFNFFDITEIIVPALLFILGIDFLMLYISDKSYLLGLLISIVFIVLGMILTIKHGSFKILHFLEAIVAVFKIYWPIIIAALVVLFVISKSSKKERDK